MAAFYQRMQFDKMCQEACIAYWLVDAISATRSNPAITLCNEALEELFVELCAL